MLRKVVCLSVVALTLAATLLLVPWSVNAADFIVQNDISQTCRLEKYVNSKGSIDDTVDEYEIKVPNGKYAIVSVSGDRSVEDVACASGLYVGSRQYVNSDIELRCNAGTSYVTVRLSVNIFDYQAHACQWRYWIKVAYYDVLPTYAVTYGPGAYGIGSLQTVTKTKGVDLVLKGAIFTRMGYTQTGWSKKDGGAKNYDLGALYVTDAAITLYPFWTKRVPVPDLAVDVICTAPASPVMRGEEVALNFTIKNIGDEVAAQTVVQIFDWEKVLGEVLVESLLAGTSCAKSYALPTLSTGKHRLSVIIATVPGEAVTDNNNSESIALQVQMQGGFSVRFDANGGIGAMADQEFETERQTLKLTANKFSKEGYVFVGWSMHSNEKPCYADESIVTRKSLSITDPDPMGSSATLYAAWGKEVVPAYPEGVLVHLYPGVVFYTGGEDGCWIEDSKSTLKSNGRFNWIAAKVRGPGTFSYVSTETSAGDDVASFYGFVGGDVDYEGLLVENLTDYHSRYGQFYRSVTISSEIDCVLGWEWYASKNDGKYMQLSELSWTADASDVYSVVYKSGAQGVGSCQTVKKKRGELLALADVIFTRTGYTQTGWAMADGGEKAYDLGAEYAFDAAVTLYPYWTANSAATCTVTFDAAGGMAGWAKGEVVKDSAVGTLPTATREGYEFLGWFTAAVGGTQVTAATAVMEDVTFYAHWKRMSSGEDDEIVPGEKVEIDTGLIGYKATGLPSGLKYDAKTGKITGSASKPTAAEGVVVKFAKKDAEDEELTIVVRAEEISVGCEGLSSGPLPAGVAGAAGGMDIQIDSEGGTKSVSVTKLPSGMKYDSKSGKITGVPTKAGDSEVVLTVTTKYGNKKTEKILVSVAAMPVMAVGTFSGFVSVGADNLGTFTLTTTDAGKLTAKVVTAAGTVSFSGTCWNAVEEGVYRATLTTKKGEKLTLTLDSTAAWDANQLSGEFTTAEIAATKKAAAVPSRSYSVSAQKNAFGKTWYFTAVGDETTGWTLDYAATAKAAALTVTLKADGTTAIAGSLPGLPDTKGKATSLKVSASGSANVGLMREGAIAADFAPVLTVNKVKTVLAIRSNLWFDRKNDHGSGVGEARFIK